MNDTKVIVIAKVEQEFEAVSAVASLSDSGITAYYKASASGDILGLPGAMGCPDSFDIFVSEDCADSAREILIDIGYLSENDENSEVAEDAAETIQESVAKSDDAPKTLNDLMPDNPVLAAVYKVILAVLAMIFIGAFIWLSDTLIAWFLGLFS